MTSKLVYVDIDGTLTATPYAPWGPIRTDVLAAVNRLIAAGHAVVLWSGRGTEYARAFSLKYDVRAIAAIGKPDVFVDDTPGIRPARRFRHVTPEQLLQEGI